MAKNPVKRWKRNDFWPFSAHFATHRASSRHMPQRFWPVITRLASNPETIRVLALSTSLDTARLSRREFGSKWMFFAFVLGGFRDAMSSPRRPETEAARGWPLKLDIEPGRGSGEDISICLSIVNIAVATTDCNWVNVRMITSQCCVMTSSLSSISPLMADSRESSPYPPPPCPPCPTMVQPERRVELRDEGKEESWSVKDPGARKPVRDAEPVDAKLGGRLTTRAMAYIGVLFCFSCSFRFFLVSSPDIGNG